MTMIKSSNRNKDGKDLWESDKEMWESERSPMEGVERKD